jgi:hypothetical protein
MSRAATAQYRTGNCAVLPERARTLSHLPKAWESSVPDHVVWSLRWVSTPARRGNSSNSVTRSRPEQSYERKLPSRLVFSIGFFSAAIRGGSISTSRYNRLS